MRTWSPRTPNMLSLYWSSTLLSVLTIILYSAMIRVSCHSYFYLCGWVFYIELPLTCRRNANQTHKLTNKTKKYIKDTRILTHQVCLSYFSSSTVRGQSRNVLIEKSYTLHTFAVNIGFGDAIFESWPAFCSCNLAHIRSRYFECGCHYISHDVRGTQLQIERGA